MYARDADSIATPIGVIRITGDDEVVDSVSILPAGTPIERGHMAAVRQAHDQVEAYFAGALQAFDLPLTPSATLRGAALRRAIADIAYGDTESYGSLARIAGSAPRAIGQACARNPFPLIVPCHRVLGANAALGHYFAGAGSETKAWLLDFERRNVEGSP